MIKSSRLNPRGKTGKSLYEFQLAETPEMGKSALQIYAQ
jgi:hypothetical protein